MDSQPLLPLHSAAHDPQATGFYGPHPPAWYEAQYPLFQARPLYPKLAALAYPRLGCPP